MSSGVTPYTERKEQRTWRCVLVGGVELAPGVSSERRSELVFSCITAMAGYTNSRHARFYSPTGADHQPYLDTMAIPPEARIAVEPLEPLWQPSAG